MPTRNSVVALAAFVSALSAATPPGIPDGWSDGYVNANGIGIHYYRAVPAPGKPVMVMAHGATDYGLNWTTLTKDLQSSFDINMMDARGHGYSDPPLANAPADAAVEDLVGFLRALKIENPRLRRSLRQGRRPAAVWLTTSRLEYRRNACHANVGARSRPTL